MEYSSSKVATCYVGILLYTRVVRVFIEPKVLCKLWVYFYIPVW